MSTRILIEPGKNWLTSSKKSKKEKVWEYELFTDIVYKIIEFFKGDDDIEIIDPSWAQKYPTIDDRAEYFKTLDYDLQISLRYSSDNTFDTHIYCRKGDTASLQYVQSFGAAYGNNMFEEINKPLPALTSNDRPGFIVSPVNLDADNLISQVFRNNLAAKLATAIYKTINPTVVTECVQRKEFINKSFTMFSKCQMKGLTLVDNLVVRCTPYPSGSKIIELTKGYEVSIVRFINGFCEIIYGGTYGYIDASLIKITHKNHSAVEARRLDTGDVFHTGSSDGLGHVNSIFTLVRDHLTKKPIGVLFKNSPVQIIGTSGDDAIISFNGIPMSVSVPLRNITIDECGDLIDEIGKNDVIITREELLRRGYTHIIL